MAPRSQKSASNKPKGEDEGREDTLQAVALADTFETRFEPFTLERPRCLLPLCNTPLIEYTLEFLANAGVEHVFLYAGAHTNQVEKYINASKWKTPSSPFKKLTFLKSTSTSVGDVMRDLDGKHLITGDFIAVSGDVVSNFPIEAALKKHRNRREKDKNAIMTMILREAGRSHRTKAQSTSPVFILDPTKDRCLHYEEMQRGQDNAYLNLDPELLASNAEIDIRQDLIDCSIDICTPEVLSLWSDSFDYQSPRKQFLFGVLKDYELNGKTIHTHIIKDPYAARVRSLKAYDAISKDIVSRWTYPLCPDTNLLQGHSYSFKRGNIYGEEGIMLARSCVIKRGTVIGRGTSIGDGSVVENSVIGRRCQIGKNVALDGAYIWDDAVIGDGSKVGEAIVANEAVIGRHCIVKPGALISFGVRLADSTTVEAGIRISKAQRDDQDPVKTDPEIVGEAGTGYKFHDPEEDEDETRSIASTGLRYNMTDLSSSNSSISTLTSELSDEPEDHQRLDGSRTGGFATSISEEDDKNRFVHDAAQDIFTRLQENVDPRDIMVELVSLRLSSNASDHQVRQAVVVAFMRHVQKVMDSGSAGAGQVVKETLTKYKLIIEKSVFDDEERNKTDKVDLLLLIQRDLLHRRSGATILLYMAKELYDQEIFGEEAYEQWWEDPRSSGDEEMRTVRGQTQPFIEWLANAEEESDDESDE